MTKKQIQFDIEVYQSVEELTAEDAVLVKKAREITEQAYAPYSNFHVSAVAMLTNGEMLTGTNQENASYPVGICAERALLSTISSVYPDVSIETIAISYHNLNGESSRPISPCGMCRQAIAEYEVRFKKSIRLILSGMSGEIYVIAKASQILPLTFTASDMK